MVPKKIVEAVYLVSSAVGAALVAAKLADLRVLLEQGSGPVDVVVQPEASRAKRLLVADMDSTMIGQECIDELADYAGKKDEIAAVTEAAMRGDMDFATALRNATGMAGDNGLGGPVAGDLLAQGFGDSRAAPDLRYATAAQTNLDGNSVDMDRERAAFADNSLKYESTLRFINGSVRTMLDAMKSHNQG